MYPDNKPPTEEQIIFLGSHNFTQLSPNSWDFVREGIVFDLSAANLDLCELIFHNKEFIK